MTLILCLDDRNGISFNGRRQSRDRAVLADIANLLGGKSLLIAEYSRGLLSESRIPFIATDGFLHMSSGEDLCFVEDRDPSPFLGKADKVVIYRWNRHYPADIKLSADLSAEGFKLCSNTEFTGYSHEKITKEIYGK